MTQHHYKRLPDRSPRHVPGTTPASPKPDVRVLSCKQESWGTVTAFHYNSTVFRTLKIQPQCRLKIGRQKILAHSKQGWNVKSKTTQTTTARVEPGRQGCVCTPVCALERGRMQSDWQKRKAGRTVQDSTNLEHPEMCTSWPQDNLCMLHQNYLWNSLFRQWQQREISLF